MHGIKVEVHHVIIIITKTTYKTDIALYLEIVLVMTKVLLPHNRLVHDMTIMKAIALLIDPHTTYPIHVILVFLDLGHIRIQYHPTTSIK